MLKFYPNKTKIIFFDLEYYVPLIDRGRKTPGGMSFSPIIPTHKILGGTFQTYYPMQDRLGTRRAIWDWNSGGEKGVLQKILKLFQEEWRSIEAKDQAGSLMLAGIGISHSDVPSLLMKISLSDILEKDKVFSLLCGCRQIDLSTATYCQFAFNQAYFSYPKTKSALYQKYLPEKKMESGKVVWDMYEAGDFSAIENRNAEEIDDALVIYKKMIDAKKKNDNSLSRLKKLEKLNAATSVISDEINLSD